MIGSDSFLFSLYLCKLFLFLTVCLWSLFQSGQVPMQGYGGMPQPQHQNPPPTGVGAAPPVQPRVRARRGQATDPHSIAERVC